MRCWQPPTGPCRWASAHPGYDRGSFDYPGRAQTAFTCVAWLLAGEGFALRLDRLPPEVRGSDTEMPWPERIALFPEAWCPTPRP